MEPSRVQLESFDVISKVLEWAGVTGDPADENSLPYAFLKLVGASATTPTVQLGGISETDWMQLVNGWKIPTGAEGETPFPLLSSQLAAVGRAARIKAGAQKTRHEYELEADGWIDVIGT